MYYLNESFTSKSLALLTKLILNCKVTLAPAVPRLAMVHSRVNGLPWVESLNGVTTAHLLGISHALSLYLSKSNSAKLHIRTMRAMTYKQKTHACKQINKNISFIPRIVRAVKFILEGNFFKEKTS